MKKIISLAVTLLIGFASIGGGIADNIAYSCLLYTSSSCTKEEAPGGQYIQAAQQAAMDEALSDAGFGIQFADVNMGTKGSRYGSRIPVNGAAVNKNGNISAGTGTVSAERDVYKRQLHS